MHVFKRAVRQCAAHAALSGEDCYNAVLAENLQFSRAQNAILAVDATAQIKPVYDEQRKLTLRVVSSYWKSTLQDAVDSKIGSGKAKVV